MFFSLQRYVTGRGAIPRDATLDALARRGLLILTQGPMPAVLRVTEEGVVVYRREAARRGVPS
jgi:hypothetical protein